MSFLVGLRASTSRAYTAAPVAPQTTRRCVMTTVQDAEREIKRRKKAQAEQARMADLRTAAANSSGAKWDQTRVVIPPLGECGLHLSTF